MQRSAPDSGCDEKAEASASRLSPYNWPGTAFLVSHWPNSRHRLLLVPVSGSGLPIGRCHLQFHNVSRNMRHILMNFQTKTMLKTVSKFFYDVKKLFLLRPFKKFNFHSNFFWVNQETGFESLNLARTLTMTTYRLVEGGNWLHYTWF